MTDLLSLAKDVAEKLVANVSDCELILVYGGVAQGRGHRLSDIDMIAIHETRKVVWEFVLNDRPICLWSMTWKKVEDTFRGQGNFWTLATRALIDSKIIWSKSEKEERKFKDLFALIDEGQKVYLEKVLRDFEIIYAKLWYIQDSITNNDLNDIKNTKWHVANILVNTLAVINNHPLMNNWGKQQDELSQFKLLPRDFVKRYNEFIEGTPVRALELGKALANEVKVILQQWLKEHEKQEETTSNIALEWAGIKEYQYKIDSAAKNNDVVASSFASVEFVKYLFWAYAIMKGIFWEDNHYYPTTEYLQIIPEEIRKFVSILLQSNDLTELPKAVENCVSKLEQDLIDRNAELPIASSLDEGIKFIQKNRLNK